MGGWGRADDSLKSIQSTAHLEHFTLPPPTPCTFTNNFSILTMTQLVLGGVLGSTLEMIYPFNVDHTVTHK